MRAAVAKGPGVIEVQDVPEPQAGPDQVKVKIAYCGICGSELHQFDPIYQNHPPQFKPGPGPARPGPRIMGHEASGVISAVGSDIKKYKVGQRVAMNFRSYCGACYYCRNKLEHFCENVFPASGGYAEYAIYKESAIYALPDNISLEEGALLEPLSVAVHTVDLSNIRPGSTLAILGGGPIGALILEVAQKAGASRILVSEPNKERRELNKQLGAHVVVDPLHEDLMAVSMKLTDGRGFDTVIEASGKLAVAKQTFSLADNGGTVVWAAMYPVGDEVGVIPSDLYIKELTLRSVFVSPYSFPRSLNMIPELNLKPLISIMPIADITKGFQALLKGQGMKILIKP